MDWLFVIFLIIVIVAILIAKKILTVVIAISLIMAMWGILYATGYDEFATEYFKTLSEYNPFPIDNAANPEISQEYQNHKAKERELAWKLALEDQSVDDHDEYGTAAVFDSYYNRNRSTTDNIGEDRATSEAAYRAGQIESQTVARSKGYMGYMRDLYERELSDSEHQDWSGASYD
jgi:hypothetical protein